MHTTIFKNSLKSILRVIRLCYESSDTPTMSSHSINKHKVICEQRLYINLCTQMKTILTEIPMYGYWPRSVFMYVRGIEVCVCAHCVCVHVVCGRVGCVCV